MPQSHPEAPYFIRHVGPQSQDQKEMLQALGYESLEGLMEAALPADIRQAEPLVEHRSLSEVELAAAAHTYANQNVVKKQLIGQGFYDTVTPAVIRRNILSNPGWYTSYTPYQAEISQGRLEAQLLFQQVVQDLTGLPIANASLLDEASAGAEAVALARRATRKGSRCLVDADLHPQILAVIETRARCLGLETSVKKLDENTDYTDCFGVVFTQISTTGQIRDLTASITAAHDCGATVIVNCDLLALTALKDPGSLGADVTFGSAQRFGVPLFYGGPHAAFMSVREGLQRQLPGRLVGVSKDAAGAPAFRLTMQTREQHIRRERATSNICTAQALLAVMAGMYAVWHGPTGLHQIANHCANLADTFARSLAESGVEVLAGPRFDTVVWKSPDSAGTRQAVVEAGYNLRDLGEGFLGASFGESHTEEDVRAVLAALGVEVVTPAEGDVLAELPENLRRESDYLTHPSFHSYRCETAMMRFLRRLADKDLALDRSMIPLGSCTMKLNPAAAMETITLEKLAGIHPLAPADQTRGWQALIADAAQRLVDITGYDEVSFQPNSGAQGEFAGLLAIKRYHHSRGDDQRNICLIPKSAHGTNAASAALAGLKVVVVDTAEDGSIDLDDLDAKCDKHAEELAAIMITYPSTHGVYEDTVRHVCDRVHRAGGQVYIDGANLNALVGVARPGRFGGDVSHLNLHKTFAIPHGGGGPGIGPILCREHLRDFLPGNAAAAGEGEEFTYPVASANFGSPGVLPITWGYLAMMGTQHLPQVTAAAVLAANYVARMLNDAFPVLYTGQGNLVAHECILDIRPLTAKTGVTAEDVAKRLIDYGFHAPTLAFPVAGTLMVEPTESEPREELDRFIAAMRQIRTEIDRVAAGEWTLEESPLRQAPHTAACVMDEWQMPYSRQVAVYPLAEQYQNKYFPPVRRIDNAFGDRNLVCSCPPPQAYTEQ